MLTAAAHAPRHDVQAWGLETPVAAAATAGAIGQDAALQKQ